MLIDVEHTFSVFINTPTICIEVEMNCKLYIPPRFSEQIAHRLWTYLRHYSASSIQKLIFEDFISVIAILCAGIMYALVKRTLPAVTIVVVISELFVSFWHFLLRPPIPPGGMRLLVAVYVDKHCAS